MATKTITIDGTSYDLESLSPRAKQQIANLRFTEAEIQRIRSQLAMANAARAAYANALKTALAEKPAG